MPAVRPYLSQYYKVSFGKHIENLYFTEITGLNKEFDVETSDLTDPKEEIVRKMPGRPKWGQLVLKRSVTANMDVYKWRKLVEQGDVEKARVNGTISVLDHTKDNVLAEWHVIDAWPSKISGPNFKSDGKDSATEELTVVYEDILRAK